MTISEWVSIVVAAGSVCFCGLVFLAMWSKTHGKDFSKDFEAVTSLSKNAEALADALVPIPVVGVPASIVKTITGVAAKVIPEAEAIYKASLSLNANTPDTRKTYVTSLIQTALAAIPGYTQSATVNKIISSVIDLLVLALPKTHGGVAK